MRNIDEDLHRWGAWAAGNIGTGIKPLAMFDDGTGRASRLCMTDEEAATFDPAVAMLRLIDKELYDVVRLHYVFRMSYAAVGRIKSVNSKEVNIRCWRAQAFISGYLHGIALKPVATRPQVL